MTETKREVFDDALAYAPVGREYDPVNDDEAGDLRSCLSARYTAALPDDLPTIPLTVSEEIKGSHDSLSLRDELESVDSTSDDFSVVDYIENSESVFAEAWARGMWIVKENGEIVKLEAEK